MDNDDRFVAIEIKLAHQEDLVESLNDALYQQGRQSHILISSVNEDSALVSVFGPKTTLGLVRFYSTSAAKRIAAVLEQACRATRIPIDLGSEVINASWDAFEEPAP